MKTYKALLITRENKEQELTFMWLEITKEKSLQELYKYLECERIDIQERYINNKCFDFIFDDEFLINGKAEDSTNALAIGIYQDEIKEMYFHKLIICGMANDSGEETDLKVEDIETIYNAIKPIYNNKLNKYFNLLVYQFEPEEEGTKA